MVAFPARHPDSGPDSITLVRQLICKMEKAKLKEEDLDGLDVDREVDQLLLLVSDQMRATHQIHVTTANHSQPDTNLAT